MLKQKDEAKRDHVSSKARGNHCIRCNIDLGNQYIAKDHHIHTQPVHDPMDKPRDHRSSVHPTGALTFNFVVLVARRYPTCTFTRNGGYPGKAEILGESVMDSIRNIVGCYLHTRAILQAILPEL